MSIDIVFPKGNEKEFIKIASRLSYSGICFVYEPIDIKGKKELLDQLQEKSKLRLFMGVLVNPKDARKTQSGEMFVLAKGGDNRQIIENIKPNLIFSLEDKERDKFNQKNSGLNQVLCKIANKNKIMVGVSFSEILKHPKKYALLGKTSQNIMLCNKYGVSVILASFASDPYEMRAPKELASFFGLFGLKQPEPQNRLLNILEKLSK